MPPQPASPRYLLLFNAHQIVQIVDDATTAFLTGPDIAGGLKILTSEANDLTVLCRDGVIIGVGRVGELMSLLQEVPDGHTARDLERVDCKGGCILPGLVDAHTHPIFAGDRCHEFAAKLAGATYMDIQKMGGGIHFTAEHTHRASEEELISLFGPTAEEMLHSGTTTIEAKSGYGLDEECELKLLRVLDRLNRQRPLEISATFCGAHAIPKGKSEEEQAGMIVERLIPVLGRMKQEE